MLSGREERDRLRNEAEEATRSVFKRVLRERLVPDGLQIAPEFNLTTGMTEQKNSAFMIWNGSYKTRIGVWPRHLGGNQWSVHVQANGAVPVDRDFVVGKHGTDAALGFIKFAISRLTGENLWPSP